MQNYETFKILFDSFGPVVNKLVYYYSNTNASKLCENGSKMGPKLKLSAEQEMFLVLVRLRCGLLDEDVAYTAGISVSHFQEFLSRG